MASFPESVPRYAELQVTSNFSFLRGAAHPDELVLTAAALGHQAIAITDRNSFAGIVRAHHAAKEVGIQLVVGCRLDLHDGMSLLAFPEDRAAYGRLTRLLTLGKRRAPKGECHLDYADVVVHGEGQIVVVLPLETADMAAEFAARVAADFARHAYLAAQHLYRGDDAQRLVRLAALSEATGLPLVATNDVLYHVPEWRPLQDVLTCIRDGCTISKAGYRLAANAERHLKPPQEMARLFRGYENAVERSLEIVERCRFNLDELRYEYPEEPIPEGQTPQQRLAELAWQGAVERFSDGVPNKVCDLIEHELHLIERLDYARYFLTVHDIVRFARQRGILYQGRGSAANSVVCYCLGITAVDPARIDVLFERFISAARNEPPDIDVDFEHERREEVIQYIYEKYGRDRAGLAATVICYRSRSAIREVGKALRLSVDVVAALAGIVWGWSNDPIADQRVREAGLDPTDRNLRLALDLAAQLVGFPRHLSQHVGGFVITRGPLSELVPIENATMEDRTVIEWDKDDLDRLGILKFDVLALGMLTCIRKAFALIDKHCGRRLDLATVPAEVPAVYEMLSRADSLGVFQVESRAQMSMLPRLKPQKFYDLVIAIAIVRPGPIQCDMVHPYLRRRSGREPVDYPSNALREVLGKTLGVPLFQEQAMKIAIVGAGFAPEDADRLRRAMATFKRNGDIHRFRENLSPVWSTTATTATSRPAASARSRGSGPTAFQRAMQRVLHCSFTSRPGSNGSIPRSLPAPCSTASRWASTRRRRSSAMPASTASRCVPSISTTVSGIARSNPRSGSNGRCASVCAKSKGSPKPMPNGSSHRGLRRGTPIRERYGGAAVSVAARSNAWPKPTPSARSASTAAVHYGP